MRTNFLKRILGFSLSFVLCLGVLNGATFIYAADDTLVTLNKVPVGTTSGTSFNTNTSTTGSSITMSTTNTTGGLADAEDNFYFAYKEISMTTASSITIEADVTYNSGGGATKGASVAGVAIRQSIIPKETGAASYIRGNSSAGAQVAASNRASAGVSYSADKATNDWTDKKPRSVKVVYTNNNKTAASSFGASTKTTELTNNLTDPVCVGLFVNNMTATFTNAKITVLTTAGATETYNITSVTTPPVPETLSPPTNFKPKAFDGKAELTWTPVAGADSYVITQDGTALAPTPSLTGTSSSYVVTGLTNGTKYKFSIQAKKGSKTSDAADIIDFSPSALGKSTLSGTANDKLASLAWTAVTGADKYVVMNGATEVVTVPTTQLAYDVTGLTNDTEYSFTVIAKRATSDTPASVSEQTTSNILKLTPSPNVPSAPTTVYAQPTDGGVSINFTPDKFAATYTIQYGTTAGTYTQKVENIPGTDITSTIRDLTNGTTYYFSVYGVNSIGNGTPSAEVSAKPGKWVPNTFGDSIDLASTTISNATFDANQNLTSVRMGVADNKGKISGNSDGISFYYTPFDATKDFYFSADALINSYTAAAQVSFGLMAREEVGFNGKAVAATVSDPANKSKLVAVGYENSTLEAFYRPSSTAKIGDTGTRKPITGVAATAGTKLRLTMLKSGNKYYLSINGSAPQIVDVAAFSPNMYVGVYVARAANITYSNIQFKEVKSPQALIITKAPNKTEYIENQALDLTGIEVTADYADSPSSIIPIGECVVSGYDPAKQTDQTISILHGGQTATQLIKMTPDSLANIAIVYEPTRTEYFLSDDLDKTGLVVKATYASGKTEDLNASSTAYTISGFDSSQVGEKDLTLSYTYREVTKTASFKVSIKGDVLESIAINRNPNKTQYYIGQDFSNTGLVVVANYAGGMKVNLLASEYTIDSSNYNKAAAGTYTITITHKGMTTSFAVTVDAIVQTGIVVATYPKTTYQIGEAIDLTGIIVKKEFNDGSTADLTSAEYTIDQSNFNTSEPKAFSLVITSGTFTTPLDITVVAAREYVWKSAIFGQSASLENGEITPSNPGKLGPNDSVNIQTTKDNAGKITDGHDGIQFYYTELDPVKDNFILTADIKVNKFAKLPTPDNQEGFGIMARDVDGTNAGPSVLNSSNIGAVGGYRGLTQWFYREGVTSINGGEGTNFLSGTLDGTRPTSSNTGNGTYKLTLQKTNSGFIMSTTINGTTKTSGEKLIAGNPMAVQDSNKMYVGFFTARLADIDVSNVSLTVTNAATDAPKVDPPAKLVTPDFSLLSLPYSSTESYNLALRANVDGTLTVKQGNTIIQRDAVVKANTQISVPTTIAANTTTNFAAVFTPSFDNASPLTSYDPIVKNLAVTMSSTSITGTEIYASPTGSAVNTGEKSSPLDVDSAIKYVKPGQTIILLDGTYTRAITIPRYNDGTADALKKIAAEPGKRPVIKANLSIIGNYWHVYGVDVTQAPTHGVDVAGSYNKVELVNIYQNGDTGLQISRSGSVGRDLWPSNNLILNCTSYENRDASENNADGFAAKLTSGDGNIFRGCIAYNNCDDGWDLYSKVETGPIGAVLVEDCIAYDNGFINGLPTKGDKNGFKLGGENLSVPHMLKNSISFGNGSSGVTSNSDPAVQIINVVSFDNLGSNINLYSYADASKHAFVADNVLSYQSTTTSADEFPVTLKSATNYFYDGTKSTNADGVELTTARFTSVTRSTPYARNADGSIIFGDFLKVVTPTKPSTGGGGSGSTLPPTPTTTTTVTTAGKVETAATVVGEIAKAVVEATKAVLEKAVSAIQQAGKQEVKSIEIAMAIPQTSGTSKITSFDVALSTSTISEIKGMKIDNVVLNLGEIKISLPMLVLNQATANNSAPLSVAVEKVDVAKTTDNSLKVAAGSGDVYQLELRANNTTFNSKFEKMVTVTLPYTLKANEKADHIAVYMYNPTTKNLEPRAGNYDAKTKAVKFDTISFSTYVVKSDDVTFGDLGTTEWARTFIETMASKGIISGRSAGVYDPQANITRAEFASLLVRMLGGLDTTAKATYTDVTASNPYYATIGSLQKLGLKMGGRGTGIFDPNATITREEMFDLIGQAMVSKGYKKVDASVLAKFTDKSDISAYAADSIALLVNEKIVSGRTATTIVPKATTTRAEAATMLYQIMNK